MRVSSSPRPQERRALGASPGPGKHPSCTPSGLSTPSWKRGCWESTQAVDSARGSSFGSAILEMSLWANFLNLLHLFSTQVKWAHSFSLFSIVGKTGDLYLKFIQRSLECGLIHVKPCFWTGELKKDVNQEAGDILMFSRRKNPGILMFFPFPAPWILQFL